MNCDVNKRMIFLGPYWPRSDGQAASSEKELLRGGVSLCGGQQPALLTRAALFFLFPHCQADTQT